MSIAFLFPGQGSQYVGMGKALCEASALARETFAAANAALGFDLQKLCFEGPEADLTLTQNTQPAILTVSVAAFRVFSAEKGIKPSVVAGHSLGEYSALVAAGALDFAEAVKTVNERGKFMQEAVPAGRGSMAALMGGTNEATEELCREVSRALGQKVELANYNGGGQLVISGDKATVERVVALCSERKELGIRRAVILPVSAPFHSSLMSPAAERLRPRLQSLKISALKMPYIANIDAKSSTDSAAIPKKLEAQIASSVLWEQSMLLLPSLGVTQAIEIGPGKVLAGLMRRIVKEIPTQSIETIESMAAIQ